MSGVGCQNDLDITHRLKISRKSVARRGVDPAADIIAFPANACSDFIKFLKYNALPLSVVQGCDGVTLKRPGDFVGAHADVFSSFLRRPRESGRRGRRATRPRAGARVLWWDRRTPFPLWSRRRTANSAPADVGQPVFPAFRGSGGLGMGPIRRAANRRDFDARPRRLRGYGLSLSIKLNVKKSHGRINQSYRSLVICFVYQVNRVFISRDFI